MRVTEGLLLNQLTSNVDTSSSSYQTIQQQLATGKKILQPSDDPSGTNQALTIRAILVNINQYQTDANSATSFMSDADSQLNSVTTLVQQARTIAVAAANGATQNADSSAAYASQIQSVIDQITTIANSDFAGEKLFAGTQTQTNPFTPGDATHAYHGDNGNLTATIGDNNVITTNVNGEQVFGPVFSALEQLKTDITTNNANAISNTDLPAIDSSLSGISQSRAVIGSKVNQISDTLTRLSTTQATYQNNLSSVEDVDLASTFASLQVAQNVYQASLVATQKALSLSLAQYL